MQLIPVQVPTGEHPSFTKFGHTFSQTTPDEFYIFGGLVLTTPSRFDFTNELFRYHFKTKEICKIETASRKPKPRHFHSAVVYNKDIFIFGGKSNGYLHDLFKFDTLTKEWIEIQALSPPSARYGHSAVTYNNCMYIYGGYDSDGFVCHDLHCLSFSSFAWTKIDLSPSASPASPISPLHTTIAPTASFCHLPLSSFVGLHHHSAVVYEDFMLIFGGVDFYHKKSDVLYVYNFSSNSFSQIIPQAGDSSTNAASTFPPARYGHACFIENYKMYVLGGRSTDQDFRDIYCINLDLDFPKNVKWKKVGEGEAVEDLSEYWVFTRAIAADGYLFVCGGETKTSSLSVETARSSQDRMSLLPAFSSLPHLIVRQIDDVPDEIMLYIFQFLSLKDICMLACVSPTWIVSRLSCHNKIWERIYAEKIRSKELSELVTKNKPFQVISIAQEAASNPFVYKRRLIQMLKKLRRHLPKGEQELTKELRYYASINKLTYTHYFVRHQHILYNMGFGKEYDMQTGLKIVLLGDGAVGKTNLALTHFGGEYPKEHVPPSFVDKYSVEATDAANTTVSYTFWDIPSDDFNKQSRNLAAFNPDVILLCFSISSPRSLINVYTKWISQIRNLCASVPIILVGTKSDLRNNLGAISKLQKSGNQCCVTKKQGEQAAKDCGCITYVECSAVNNTLQELFRVAVAVGSNKNFTQKMLQSRGSQPNKTGSAATATECVVQ